VPSRIRRPAALGGELQLPLGLPAEDILGRKQHGSVPADDLLTGIAKDALGSRIPALHDAGEIQEKDRVVGRGFDNQSVQFVFHFRSTWRFGTLRFPWKELPQPFGIVVKWTGQRI
jgi:hypothetical protein